MDYVRDTMDWLMGKGRRKADKDPPSSDGTPGPPYLEPAGARFPTQFVTPALLPAYVRLPLGVDQDEWLATHTISFFEHVNLLYSCLSEYCTDCSSMNGPHQSQYYWLDEKGKKTKTPAACYVDFVMSFVHKLITDESVFPTKYGNTFPPNFLCLVKRAWRYLFHVIAHIYAAHFVQLFSLQLHPHLHTLFVHFSVFNKEFGLVEEEETRVLDDLLDLLLSEGMGGSAGALPALTTSQSDSALHNKTRLDSSPTADGDSSGDAWSLPPSGVPSTTTKTSFFGNSSLPSVGSAPLPLSVVNVVHDASPIIGADDDTAAAAAAASSASPQLLDDANATFDDSLDEAMLSVFASSSPTHQIFDKSDKLFDVEDSTMDDGAMAAVVSGDAVVDDVATLLTTTETTVLTIADAANGTELTTLPSKSEAIALGYAATACAVVEASKSQQPQPSELQQPSSFLAHRGLPSHSSGASSNEKSRSSSGHSTDHSGDAGATVATPLPVSSAAAAAGATEIKGNNNDDVEGEKDEEEDKENLLPMTDLSASTEGAAAILVESMEVAEGHAPTDEECRR